MSAIEKCCAFCVLMLLAVLLPLQAGAVTLFGKPHVPLSQVAGRLGMTMRWVEPGKSVQLSSQWSQLRFTEHRRDAFINGVRVHLGDPVVKHHGKLYISELDYRKTLLPILAPQNNGPAPQLRRILLDPGHGGKDTGGTNAALGLVEKTLTLDFGRRLKALLEARGYEVRLTRDSDVYLSLENRPVQANRLGADLFVSLHFNAAADSAAAGVETFAMTPVGHRSSNASKYHSSQDKTYPGNQMDNWSELAAYQVQQSLKSALATEDRGVRRSRFAVLCDLQMPGILIEGGFMTNPSEGRQLGSAAFRQKLAEACAQGIADYHQMLEQARARQ